MLNIVRRAVFALFLSTSIFLPNYGQSSTILALIQQMPQRTLDGRTLIEVPFGLLAQYFLQVHSQAKQAGQDVLINTKRYEVADAALFDPKLTFSVNKQRTVNGRLSSGALVLTKGYHNQLDARLSGLTESGYTYSLSYGIDFLGSRTSLFDTDNNPTSSSSENQVNNTASAEVKIPFFQDSDPLVISRSRLVAASKLEQSKASLRLTQYNILSELNQVYWNLIGLYENVKAQRERVRFLRKVVKQAEERLSLGVGTRTEYLEAQSRLRIDTLAVDTIYLTIYRIEDEIKIALDLPNIPYGLYPVDPMQLAPEPQKAEELVDQAKAYSPQLDRLSHQSQQADLDIAAAKNKQEHDIDLTLSYSLNGFGTGFGKSVSFYGNEQASGYQAKLSWSMPLGGESVSADISRALLEKEKVQQMIDKGNSDIQNQVRNLLRNLKLQSKEIESATEQVLLSRRILETKDELYTLGKSSLVELIQAQSDLSGTQRMLIAARVKYETLHTSLKLLTGKISPESILSP